MRAVRAALAALVGLAACGYHSGLEPPGGFETVGLEVFANDSRTDLVPDIERDLQDALGRAVERMLDATLVPPDRAELVVSGRILSYRRRRGIQSPDNELLETGVRIAVTAELRERGEGGEPGPLVRRTNYSNTRGFVLEDFGAEEVTRTWILENIAERLVLDLFAPVAYEP